MADDVNDALGIPSQEPAAPAGQAGSLRVRRAGKLAHRYKTSYELASLLVKLGHAVRIIGFVLGGIAVICGLIAAIAQATDNEAAAGLGIFLMVLLYTAVIVFLMFIYGTVVAGIGQLIEAVSDGAVFNSPFLDDDERAKILSLDD